MRNIKRYSYLADFQEALNLRGIIPFIKENNEYFVDYLKSELGDILPVLTRILLNETSQIDVSEMTRCIESYQYAVSKCLSVGDEAVRPGIIKVYQEILISTAQTDYAQECVASFLNGRFLSRFNLKADEILAMETDMAIALAGAQKMLPVVLPWIIQYFSQTKTATIDLNRYKLEAFLMTNEYPKVNETICNAIFDRNCYIREHMSDIIGEKRLYAGIPNLCKQLQNEENYYSAVSIIEALGKLNDSSSLHYILEWVSANEQAILDSVYSS